MPLTDEILEDYIHKIKEHINININEEDTRGILIDPLLKDLRWNIFDIKEISRNTKTSSGGFVDYVLKVGKNKIYLEAKPLTNKFSLLQHYSFAFYLNLFLFKLE